MRLSIRQVFKGFYKLCECNCGTLISVINTKGRFSRYAYRHNFINISLNPGNRDKTGPNSSNWKGGRTRDRNYWFLLLPNYFSSAKNGRIYEHIYFYQEYYQCSLLPWGVVHHIIPCSKDYCNNMPWNLMGMTRSAHQKLHRSIKKQILNEL